MKEKDSYRKGEKSAEALIMKRKENEVRINEWKSNKNDHLCAAGTDNDDDIVICGGSAV